MERDVNGIEPMVVDDWLLVGSSSGVVLAALALIGGVWWHYNLPSRLLRNDVSVRLGQLTLAILGCFCLILTALVVLIAVLILQGIWIPAQRWNFLGSAGLGLSVSVLITLTYYMVSMNVYMPQIRQSVSTALSEGDEVQVEV